MVLLWRVLIEWPPSLSYGLSSFLSMIRDALALTYSPHPPPSMPFHMRFPRSFNAVKFV